MKMDRKPVGKPSTISIFEFHKYGNETMDCGEWNQNEILGKRK
jgi:hypothetical protein